MKRITSIGCIPILAAILIVSGSFNSTTKNTNDLFTGAWYTQNAGISVTWVFIDGYAVMTTYDKDNKKFIMSSGGPYSVIDGQVKITLEFNTWDSMAVGSVSSPKFTINGNELTEEASHVKNIYKRLDNGTGPLAGVWYIAGRLENGQVNERQLGPRRTLKVLSGTRFQWIAINPSVKGFYGTGGGSYTFANGKYTENIEFFPRDNSRVGTSLTFDGKIENGAWMHSGLSSRGEPLNEVWKRLPKS